MTIEENILKEINDLLISKIDSYFKEGLERKGYNFKNKKELENFVTCNCKYEDFSESKQKIYFVNNNPFLMIDYNIDITPIIEDKKGNITIKGSCGSYSYL